MKKYYLIAFLVGILFAACDPNKSIYEDLDAMKKPYTEQTTYTMTAADYGSFSATAVTNGKTTAEKTLAGEIKTYSSFGFYRPVNLFTTTFNSFFKGKFPALNPGSSVILNYNYSNSTKAVEHPAGTAIPLASNENKYTLVADDYIVMGGAIKTNGFITTSVATEITTLTNYIPALIPIAAETQYLILTYKTSATESLTSYFSFDGVKWNMDSKNIDAATNLAAKAYFLVAQDYTDIAASTVIATAQQVKIPLWLKVKFPVAIAGDTKILIYNASATETRVCQYTYDGTTWNDFVTKTEQYSNTDNGWLPDPTIRFTMIATDYQKLCDYTKDSPTNSGYYNQRYKNEEYFYGANAFRINFDFKVANRTGSYVNGTATLLKDPRNLYTDKSLDDNTVAFNTNLKEGLRVLLTLKYPTQTATSNGVQVYVEVTYQVYTGVSPAPKYTAKYKVVGTGAFELVQSSYTSVSAIK